MTIAAKKGPKSVAYNPLKLKIPVGKVLLKLFFLIINENINSFQIVIKLIMDTLAIIPFDKGNTI